MGKSAKPEEIIAKLREEDARRSPQDDKASSLSQAIRM